MRKRILKWLLKDYDFKSSIEYLEENIKIRGEHIETIRQGLETLEKQKEILKILEQVLDVCKKHGIDIDEELEV